jgi:hypothetical protein
MNIYWLCGKPLVPTRNNPSVLHFAEVRDLDGNVLRVHKSCKADAERQFHPANFGAVPTPDHEGYTPPARDSDDL